MFETIDKQKLIKQKKKHHSMKKFLITGNNTADVFMCMVIDIQ